MDNEKDALNHDHSALNRHVNHCLVAIIPKCIEAEITY